MQLQIATNVVEDLRDLTGNNKKKCRYVGERRRGGGGRGGTIYIHIHICI